MKDPHVHVQKEVIFSGGQLRMVIAQVTGLACDEPKTVATGCGRRRPFAATSLNPSSVTCLPCREHARAEHEAMGRAAEACLVMPGVSDSDLESCRVLSISSAESALAWASV